MSDDLKPRITEWLEGQGYPLEFAVAACFSAAGYHVTQGFHVNDGDGQMPREIDVIADVTTHCGDVLSRVEFVVECKWSVDKPWVVFCADARMAPSACVAQALGSPSARAALWALSGDETLERLALFASPVKPGFGGRQALGKKDAKDSFFEALKSVTAVADAAASRYAPSAKTDLDQLKAACVVFPVIVVRGRLFKATFDSHTKELMLDECGSARLHWRGSHKRKFNTTVDIVTEHELPVFAKTRLAEAKHLAKMVGDSLEDLEKHARAGTMKNWPIKTGARGFLGTPELLQNLMKWSLNQKVLTSPRRGVKPNLE